MEDSVKQKNSKNASAKPKELPIEIMATATATATTEGSVVETSVEKFPAIKSMIEKLDKFLSRRIASIGLFYLFAMIACGSALIANGVVSGASTDGGAGAGNSINIWLYSIIATISFIILLIFIRVFAVRIKSKRQRRH